METHAKFHPNPTLERVYAYVQNAIYFHINVFVGATIP